jgi:tight adherence protein C
VESDVGLLYYTSLALIGLSVYLIAIKIFTSEEQFKASEKLEEAEGRTSKDRDASAGFVLQYSRPIFKRYISPIIANMKNKKKIRDQYKRPLASAGLTDELTPDDFYAFKLFLILGFPILFLMIRAFLEMDDWPLTLAPVMGIVGFFYPNLWIDGKIKERQKDVLMNLPFVVDMLALSVEAGLDFMAAMTKVSDKAKRSALVEELEIILKDVRIGSSRAEALRQFAWRTNIIEVSSFCATLIAADSVGASIGPILKVLAGDIRQKKSAQIEQEGAKAATKILFPMLFLITPAVFIVIAGPIILEFVYGAS